MGAVTPEQGVDSIQGIFGRHQGLRAAHARGVVCRGIFKATPEAARLTRASHLQGQEVEAVVRFSNASGHPDALDSKNPCGMATKFCLPDGSKTDIVAVTLERFFARTPEEFVRVNWALKRNPKTGAPTGPLTRLPKLLVSWKSWHGLPRPTIDLRLLRLLWELRRVPIPESYATCQYNGLNAFKWLDAGGRATFVRYQWVPLAPPACTVDKEKPDYLRRELTARLASGPVTFHLAVQVARDGIDPIDDPTELWAGKPLTVGELEVRRPAEPGENDESDLDFDPTDVPDGIELSEDPILRFRHPSYGVSVRRRGKRPMQEWAGRAGALTVITPIPRIWRIWLLAWHWVRFTIWRGALKPKDNISRLVGLSFISFAHWSTFGINSPVRRRRQDYILFETNFFGDTEAYIEAFSYVVPDGIKRLWSGVGPLNGAHGVPDPQPWAPFYAYIADKRTPPVHYYSAYPAASTSIVLSALEVVDHFRELVRKSGEPFEERWREFLTAVQRRTPPKAPALFSTKRSLSVLTPVCPGHVEALEQALSALPGGENGGDSPLARIGTTHFARWSIVPYLEYRDETALDSTSYLLFTSWFDGSVKQYAYALAVMLPEEADSIWGHCAGYPGSADKNAFRRYLLEHRKKPGLPFASYPEASVAKVRSSLALQERVIEFALDARDLEGPALETAFRQRFPEVV